jgi:hypothetical protein
MTDLEREAVQRFVDAAFLLVNADAQNHEAYCRCVFCLVIREHERLTHEIPDIK